MVHLCLVLSTESWTSDEEKNLLSDQVSTKFQVLAIASFLPGITWDPKFTESVSPECLGASRGWGLILVHILNSELNLYPIALLLTYPVVSENQL